ncbi:hypothetical protein AMATHDRAFT_1208 [Amanita thiersii Skay4041]|uniref:Coiled-coil domain-containing protein n=1 Tax=Amanita thiersii Skay4041 TaxID=703135 RepID=A0A2A9NZL3_9AGAR|nr:hypothetical protein AMATHDRAFT_1208 [Amanita thiersii Skay4041]
MPPKGVNSKKESGRAKKAENEAKKQAAAAAEKAYTKGGKAAKLAKEEKRKAGLSRKAENARLLAEEEANSPSVVKSAPKAGAGAGAGAKKPNISTSKPAGPGSIAAGGGLDSLPSKNKTPADDHVESYTASGIDNALDLLDVVTAKMDKASVGQQAANIERHPESAIPNAPSLQRRFKAAFEAYQEQELPKLKEERPGLRLQQYKDLLFKQFQKSPDNPFNQTTIAYDATKEEKLEALKIKRKQVEERLRDKSA